MTNLDAKLIAHIGVDRSDLDIHKVLDLVVEAFVFHEEMSNLAIKSINDAYSHNRDVANSNELWSSFETNNMLAFALRDILMKASELPD
jgi:hypothetical protein